MSRFAGGGVAMSYSLSIADLTAHMYLEGAYAALR